MPHPRYEDEIIGLFKNEHTLDGPTIESKLPHLHKATLYRNLNRLTEKGILREVRLDNNVMVFELADREHHHHVVCTSCNKVESFEAPNVFEKKIEKLEKRLGRKLGFTLDEHVLDFYGVCTSCQAAD